MVMVIIMPVIDVRVCARACACVCLCARVCVNVRLCAATRIDWLASRRVNTGRVERTLFFSAWPGSGAPLSRYLERALYKF